MSGRTNDGDSSPPDHKRASQPSAQTQAERKAAQRRAERRKKRRLVRVGQVFMLVAVVMALSHAVMHMQARSTALLDLVAGYPMAAALAVIGAILMGR